MDFCILIIILELLIINCITCYTCSKKKKSPFITWCSLILFTGLLTIVITSFNSGNYNNIILNGLFILSGFLLIIPFKFLFDQPIKHIIIIMCLSYIYTIVVFSLSFNAAHLLPERFLCLAAVIIQTLLYVVTIPFYLRFINKRFVNILTNIENQMINSLLVISLFWFILIFLLNYTFVEGGSFALQLIMLFVTIANAVISYNLVYSLVFVKNKAKVLSKITKVDTLTQLKNREAMYEDAKQKIKNNKPFTIIFADLDVFKSVNDEFGHAVGDAYIMEFVRTAKEVFHIKDGFYRLHGDEFVFLIDGAGVETFCWKMERLQFIKDPHGVAFRGLSLGYASYPTDANNLSDLLYKADFNMYQVKKERHRG